MNNSKIIFFLFLGIGRLFAQTPQSDFAISASACRDQRLETKNLSTNATVYDWDFCLEDIKTLKKSADIIDMPTLNGGVDYKLIQDEGNWYAFVLSENNSRIIRLDFGSDPTNMPTVVDLGNPGGQLSFPEGLDIIKFNGKWYGFVGHFDIGYGIVRLDFGNSLNTIPLATNIGDFGYSVRFRDLKLVEQGVDVILILSNYSQNSIVRVNFGSSIINTNPTIFDTGSILGVSLPIGIDLVKNGSNWILHVVSYLSNSLVQVDFGSDLLSSPISQSIYSFTGVSFPYKIKMLLEGDNYYSVISNETANIVIIDFKDLNPANAPTNLPISGLPALVGLSVFRWKGQSIVHGVKFGNSKFKTLVFEAVCDASIIYSAMLSPQLSYSQAGSKKIELTAINTISFQKSSAVKSILVSSSIASDITFSTDGTICSGNAIQFSTSTLGSIASYQWDFGDGQSDIGNLPSHIFSAGSFLVKLHIVSANGCDNFTSSPIKIYNSPVASFSPPSASPLCTNQKYSFTNTSPSDVGSNPLWQWSVNGLNVSTGQDLSFLFGATAPQQVKLIASIPGCSTQASQTINTLTPGPLVDFTLPTNGCQSTSLSAVNITSGSVTSYAWDFGDGNTSSSINGANTYANTGNYIVTLQANNAAGCQNSVTKPITIYSKPQANFSIGLPPFSCAGTPSQFTDTTPSPTDSNLITWNWNFGDSNNGTSAQKNPTYQYSTPNNYNVSLTVASNFGCIATVQKSITISPSPIASFTNTAACVNQVTQFTDASSGSIQSRQWLIQGSIFSVPNPQFTFSSSNTFPVQLTATGTNGCIGQTTKNIVVPVAPSLDFTVQAPCANNPTIFTEVSNNVDPVVSQGWVFGSLANGSGSPAQFSFPTPNTYIVKLNSTRQSGCVYSVSKNISIISPPIADFTISIDAGPAPLNVSFVNNSIQATSYQWVFGDKNNTTSALLNPSFIFSDLGDYTVQLKATNAFNCNNTFSRIVSVVIPKIDLIMNDFYLTNDASGALQPTISILSKSNVAVTDPIVLITSSDGVQIKKKIIATLKPNQELIQQLDFLIVPRTSNYLCAEVIASGNVDLFLNRKCLTINGDEILFAPFPNPTKSQLNLDWVSVDGSDVSFQIINSSGTIFLQQSVSGILKGINRLVVNTSNLASGVYLIRFKDSKKDKAFSFIVSGN